MQLDGPKFVPKAVLTAGRLAHQPFEVPTEMTKSALVQGGAIHAAVGGINKAAADAVAALEPRGPAKLLEKLFGKVDGSLVHSAGQAKQATEVFWVPFSNGAHEIGHAVSNPFSLFYAKRAGFEIPEDPAEMQAMLKGITNPSEAPDGDQSTKFPGFKFPVPPPPAEEPKPDPKPGEGEGGDTKTGEGGDTKTGEGEGGETKTGESKTGEGEGGDTTTGEGGDTKTGEGEGGGAGAGGGAGGGEGGGDATTTTTTGEAEVVVDEAAVDTTAVDPAAHGGGETGSVTPPEGARSIAPPEVSAQSHPGGIDPAVMAAAAAASVATQSTGSTPTDTAPVQDATAGTDAITAPVQDEAPVQPPVITETPAVDAPVQPPVVTEAPAVHDTPSVSPSA
ncbi:MAG: hypothetical protein JWL76_259 [Thermoleophilia bacterium]|nr:hypothetical protein [Thermoleophilia bacterium]